MTRYLAAACVIASTLAAGGIRAGDAIWGRTLPPQPFERAPFREVKVPAWVEETTGVGYTLSVMSTAQREEAAALGVTISEMGFVDPLYVYYDSALLSKRNPHVPPERLAKDIAEYKRLGVRILGVYPPTLQGEVYEKHPGWRRVTSRDGKVPEVDMAKHPHGGMLCILGPYGDFFIEVLAEILTKFPEVDAFSFDGLHYGGFCYCENCREGFKKDTAKEIPAVNMENPDFRRYQHWADRRIEECLQRLQARLKRIKPDVALVTWTTNAGRFGHFRDIPRNMPARMNLLFDAPDQEFWLDETNRGGTVVPAFANAYIWAVTNHRVAFSEPYLMTHGNPYSKDSFPGHEAVMRMMLALTYGAGPSIAVLQPRHLEEPVKRGLRELKKRKPWVVRKRPERWAALLMSDNTRNFYGRKSGEVEERYLSNVLGVFRTAIEEHLPLTVINDWNLNAEDLAGYKVLILPNAASLDDGQVRAVRQFVDKGGGLVASVDTSLFDEFGDAREGFALGEVLGVRYGGLPEGQAAGGSDEIDVNFAKGLGADYWAKRKEIFLFKYDPASFLDEERLKGLIGGAEVTFKGQAIRVAPYGPSARQVAGLRREGQGGGTLPAIVTNSFGKGRSVYLAAGLDSAYYLYPFPYQRLVLKRAIEWAAAAPRPVVVEAPMCVHTSVFRQELESGSRLVIHLFNDVNTTAFHALPNDDVPLREESLPIHGIRVTLRGYDVAKAHLQPEGLELEVERSGAESTVVVPRLDVHSMVVAELGS
jgi:hypothetical protein